MNLTWKKATTIILGSLVAATLAVPALADTTSQSQDPTTTQPGIRQINPGFHQGRGGADRGFGPVGFTKGFSKGFDKGFDKGFEKGFGRGPMTDEQLAAMAQKQGITVDQLKAKIQQKEDQAKAQMEQKLADAAKAKGLTVEQYKAQMQQERQAQEAKRKADAEQKLADAAKAVGLTVDQYKAQQEQQRFDAAAERYAKQKGVTVDQAKAQMKDNMINRLVSQAKAFGISLDDLKTKLGQ